MITVIDMYPNVSIIILNWNGWKDSIECLESIYQINYPNFNLILVDNDSEDDSLLKIKQYLKGKIKVKSDFFEYNEENKPIFTYEYFENELQKFKNDSINLENLFQKNNAIIIKNFDNKGYADGNNVGMCFVSKYLNSDYILILNNDVVVDADFLKELIIIAQKNPNAGILGPANLSYYEPNKVDSLGAKMNFWIGGWKALDRNITLSSQMAPKEVDFVGGAAFLIKREVIEKIGVFYSPYFANWEETEYCIRAKKNGFDVISVPTSKIWHKVSSSISLNNPTRIYWILRNNLIFMRRNAKLWYFPSFFLFYFFLRVPSFIYYGVRGNSIQNVFKLISTITKAIIEGLTFKINKS